MITVLSNQSLLDIAIQEDGNVLAAFEWALANGISITEELVPGQKLITPKLVANRIDDIADYFKKRKQNVATSNIKKKNNHLGFPYEFAIQF